MIPSLVGLGALAVAALPIGAILDLLAADTRRTREAAAWAAHIAEMWSAPEREDLAGPEPLPVRPAATDLDDEPPCAPVDLDVADRLLAGLRRQVDAPPYPWRLPLEPELAWLYARGKRRPEGDDTQEFWLITAPLAAEWRCDSCATGRDGEPLHVSCAGCGCACGTTGHIGHKLEAVA